MLAVRQAPTGVAATVGVLAGGGAYAASKIGPKEIGKNAVLAKHIKKGAVKTPKITNGAVTAAKLAERFGYAKIYNLEGGTTAWARSGLGLTSEAAAA